MLEFGYIDNLRKPLAFWIANCDEKNMPYAVRCVGVKHNGTAEEITAYIPQVWSSQFEQNLQYNNKVTLLGTCVPTYESYQYKGEFLNLRASDEQEVANQHTYLCGFCGEVAKLGLSWQGFYDSYFQQPTLAITFRVTSIFNQSPYKGTGGQLKATV